MLNTILMESFTPYRSKYYKQHLIKIILDISKIYTPATSDKIQLLVPGIFLERYTLELGRTRDLSTGLEQPSTILAKFKRLFLSK